MPTEQPRSFLARHGEPAWTDSRQHNGHTVLPLDEHGEERSRLIGENSRPNRRRRRNRDHLGGGRGGSPG